MRSSLAGRGARQPPLNEAARQIPIFTMSKMPTDPEGSETTSWGPQPLPTDPLTEWWSQTGSNRRPPACKAGALPTELWPRSERHPAMIQSDPSKRRQAQRAAVEAPAAVNPPGPERLVGLGRLELPTSRLSGVRSNHLSYRPERLENSCATRKKEKRRRRHPACWGLTGPDCSNDEPIGPDYPENPEGSSLERR
jgi:hypothetical protein